MLYIKNNLINFKSYKQSDELALELLNYKFKSITSIDISKLTTNQIKNAAFYNFTSLTDIKLPPNLEEIPNHTFDFCPNLKTISLPNNISVLGVSSFAYCGITSLILPDSVKEIKSNAFTWCESLKTVQLNEGLTTIGYWVFNGDSNLQECKVKGQDYTIPKSVEEIGNGLFQSTGMVKITIPEGNLTRIPDNFCQDCNNLETVNIPSTITYINSTAFQNCDGITINIDKPKDSISGAPWGATNATVNWQIPQFFKFTVNSGDNSTYGIPVMNTSVREETQQYNWVIDWGDGTTEEASGIPKSNSFITHTYPAAGTNYQITISPKNNKELSWGRAFGYRDILSDSYQNQVISLDSPITKNMWFDNGTNNNVGNVMFANSTQLTMGPEFNLPQDEDITSVGSGFMYGMFYGCSSLTMNDIFNLPQGITEVKDAFCYRMFEDNYNLKLNSLIQIPQNITTVDTNFLRGMFLGCSSITDGIIHFFGNLNLTQSEIDKTGVFKETFRYCRTLNEKISKDTIPLLSIIPASNNYCFGGCSNTDYCPDKWGGSLSTNYY